MTPLDIYLNVLKIFKYKIICNFCKFDKFCYTLNFSKKNIVFTQISSTFRCLSSAKYPLVLIIIAINLSEKCVPKQKVEKTNYWITA